MYDFFINACKDGNLEEFINLYNKDKPNIGNV